MTEVKKMPKSTHQQLKRKALQIPAVKKAYSALKTEFDLLKAKLNLKTRKR